MNLYVGTSGYSYKEWKGSFYPADLPAKQMLSFYGQHFRSVEINSSFYRMPEASVLEAWSKEVPSDFKFVLKVWQQITHRQRLRNSAETLADFLKVARVLNERQGPLFFQLPPFQKKDAALLRDFLTLLPQDIRTAFEFRHPSWFDAEVFDLLRERHVALCIAEAENDLEVPFEATANWGYLRLRRTDYGDKELKSWAKRVRAQKWTDAFVFFKHEDTGTGPQFSQKFLKFAS